MFMFVIFSSPFCRNLTLVLSMWLLVTLKTDTFSVNAPIRQEPHKVSLPVLMASSLFLASMLQVGEFRAHAAEWTANVTAEFKETRRRLSVEIYDKFQRATSVKRKLSAELAGNHSQELTPCRRTLSVNHLTSEREVLPPLLKAESIYLNGLTPQCAGEEIAVIENMK